MAEVLVDTDVFVDHLRGAARLWTGRDRLAYSVITRAELFAGDAEQESAVAAILAPFRELPVDRAVAEAAGRMRRRSGVRLPDALIAATALQAGIPLLTRNRRDFERIPRLRLRTPR